VQNQAGYEEGKEGLNEKFRPKSLLSIEMIFVIKQLKTVTFLSIFKKIW
jgi:hypothetical protein